MIFYFIFYFQKIISFCPNEIFTIPAHPTDSFSFSLPFLFPLDPLFASFLSPWQGSPEEVVLHLHVQGAVQVHPRGCLLGPQPQAQNVQHPRMEGHEDHLQAVSFSFQSPSLSLSFFVFLCFPSGLSWLLLQLCQSVLCHCD